METFSALLAICAGSSPATDEVPAQRPMTRSFGDFFDLLLNIRLSKQSWGMFCRVVCLRWRLSFPSIIFLYPDSKVHGASMGPTWGPPGSCRPQMGPVLASWTLLSGNYWGCVLSTDRFPFYWLCTTDCVPFMLFHDDVIKRKHFPRYWPFVRENPLTKASEAELLCYLWSASTKCWANNRNCGDLRAHRAHYDVTIMIIIKSKI